LLIPSLGFGIYYVIGCVLLDLCGRLDSVLEQSALQLRPVEIDVFAAGLVMRYAAPAGEFVHVRPGNSGESTSFVEGEDVLLPCKQLFDTAQPLLHADFIVHNLVFG